MKPRHIEISKRAMEAARHVCLDSTIAELSELFAVSPRSLGKARRILRLGSDEIIRAVELGQMGLETADREIGQRQVAARKKSPAAKRCVKCHLHRMEIDRLREQLAEMKSERDRYYAELETVAQKTGITAVSLVIATDAK